MSVTAPWMLSYDDAPEVRALYGRLIGIDGRVIDQTYSAHPVGGASFIGRELFFSNRKLPKCEIGNNPKPHVGLTILGGLNAVPVQADGSYRAPIERFQS